MNPVLKRAVWWLNTAGFVFYLAWLASMNDRQILREQDGIVYFLPVIPFFFVYMLLIGPKPAPPAKEAAPPDEPAGLGSRPRRTRFPGDRS
jgi:hypothetical protein